MRRTGFTLACFAALSLLAVPTGVAHAMTHMVLSKKLGGAPGGCDVALQDAGESTVFRGVTHILTALEAGFAITQTTLEACAGGSFAPAVVIGPASYPVARLGALID